MKASDLFIECLEQEGVEYIFGVPGEENLDKATRPDAATSFVRVARALGRGL